MTQFISDSTLFHWILGITATITTIVGLALLLGGMFRTGGN